MPQQRRKLTEDQINLLICYVRKNNLRNIPRGSVQKLSAMLGWQIDNRYPRIINANLNIMKAAIKNKSFNARYESIESSKLIKFEEIVSRYFPDPIKKSKTNLTTNSRVETSSVASDTSENVININNDLPFVGGEAQTTRNNHSVENIEHSIQGDLRQSAEQERITGEDFIEENNREIELQMPIFCLGPEQQENENNMTTAIPETQINEVDIHSLQLAITEEHDITTIQRQEVLEDVLLPIYEVKIECVFETYEEDNTDEAVMPEPILLPTLKIDEDLLIDTSLLEEKNGNENDREMELQEQIFYLGPEHQVNENDATTTIPDIQVNTDACSDINSFRNALIQLAIREEFDITSTQRHEAIQELISPIFEYEHNFEAFVDECSSSDTDEILIPKPMQLPKLEIDTDLLIEPQDTNNIKTTKNENDKKEIPEKNVNPNESNNGRESVSVLLEVTNNISHSHSTVVAKEKNQGQIQQNNPQRIFKSINGCHISSNLYYFIPDKITTSDLDLLYQLWWQNSTFKDTIFIHSFDTTHQLLDLEAFKTKGISVSAIEIFKNSMSYEKIIMPFCIRGVYITLLLNVVKKDISLLSSANRNLRHLQLSNCCEKINNVIRNYPLEVFDKLRFSPAKKMLKFDVGKQLLSSSLFQTFVIKSILESSNECGSTKFDQQTMLEMIKEDTWEYSEEFKAQS